MPNFDAKFIEKLKSQIDIVDLIGQYAHLKMQGGQYWACCPLPGHSERTPSFAINKDGQFYHCFGCGKSGDQIKFVQEVESLEFVEAVKFLCNKYNIDMPEDDSYDQNIRQKTAKKERLYSVLRETALFYVANLNSPKAQPYIDYMYSRGLTDSVIRRFGLGASLDFDSLPKHLLSKGFTQQEMIDSGVVGKSDGGRLFDSQGERLIFPMINNLGNVMAFCGRIISKKSDVGKYKNTRETPVFVKNKQLYNINNLKKEKTKGGLTEVIVVEGHMDAVSVYNAGFKNVVASMGTSLTKEQAKLLKRYSENVIICYDGDSAGEKGMIRGLEILAGEGLNVRVVCLPEGMDPDDVIKKLGSDAFQNLLKSSLPLIDYKLYLIDKKYPDKTQEARMKRVEESVKVIATVPTQAEKEDRLKRLSQKENITYESLSRDLDKNQTAVQAPTVSTPQTTTENGSDAMIKAERFILLAVLYNKPYASVNDLREITFKDDLNVKITAYVLSKTDQNEEVKMSLLPDIVGEENLSRLNELLLSGEGIWGREIEKRYYKDCLDMLVVQGINDEIERLNLEYEQENDTVKRKEISEKILQLTSRLLKR